MAHITREKFKTRQGVFDKSTNEILFKLSTQGFFDNHEELIPLSRGKEAHVFLAQKGEDMVAIKIYNVQNCDFNKMFDYLRQDQSYHEVKRNRRGVVFAWTQKEYRNLLKARQEGVSVPTPHTWKNNVLVMESIGGHTPAPKLKDEIPENPKNFFLLVIEQLKKIYNAQLIHGDISQFNILNLHDTPVYIDFSQATTPENPNAEFLLRRDIKNICTFFRKLGVDAEEKQLYQQIKG